MAIQDLDSTYFSLPVSSRCSLQMSSERGMAQIMSLLLWTGVLLARYSFPTSSSERETQKSENDMFLS